MDCSKARSPASLTLAALGLWICALSWPGLAQEYPSREIRAICTSAAGAGGDALVRYYGDKLSKLAGKPVIVENRAGAQGLIGTDYVARAKPDGYTILVTPVGSTLAAAPYIFKNLPYDPIKDFAPVAPITRLNFVVAVAANSPIRSVSELIAQLKKKPDQGSYGMGNNTGQVAAELFKEMAGLKTLQIAYKTSVQGITDLVNGQLDFLVWDATFMSGQARSGRLRLIAVTGANRSTALPEVPTLDESGLSGYDITSWWGIVAPAGTPRPIVERLSGWINRINSTEETRQFLYNVATDVLTGSPDDMAAMLKNDTERWRRFAAVANIVPQ